MLAVNLSLVSLAWYKHLMSLTTERILEDVLALPEDQRAELAVRLLQSLDREGDPDAEEAWAAEMILYSAATPISSFFPLTPTQRPMLRHSSK